MKLILSRLAYFKKEAVFSPLFKLFEAILDLLVPIVLADIIDKGISGQDTLLIKNRFIILIIMAFAGILLSLIAQYFAAKAAVGTSSKIKVDLFHKIQTLSFADLDVTGTASIITRLTEDITSVKTGVNLGLRLLLRSPFIVFGSLLCSFLIDWKSGLIFTCIVLVLFVIVFVITFGTLKRYSEIQNKTDIILTQTRETLAGAKVIKAFTKENDEYEKFVKQNNILTKLQVVTSKISLLLNPLTLFLINITIVVFLLSNKTNLSIGILTTGQVVALYNYLSQILVELIKLSNLVITESKTLAASKRIDNILKIESEKVCFGSSKPNNFDINLDNVSFQYRINSLPTLKNINFSIPYGSKIGIIGGTGSGKSTLIELLSGNYRISSGSIKIGDTEICDIDEKYMKDTLISYVPQHAQLFSGSVRENMSMNKDIDDALITDALKDACIFDQIDKKGGLDYMLTEGGSNLSGGQRQRLCIARALSNNGKILILDDSFSALDYATEKDVRSCLMKKENTVIIVSQRVSSIMNCENIIVLNDGEIVGIGKHSELLDKCEIYKEICLTQLKENPS